MVQPKFNIAPGKFLKKNLIFFSVQYIGLLTYFILQLGVGEAKAQMSFVDLAKKMEVEKKNIVVYFSSEYCIYCRMQEAQIKQYFPLKQRLERDYYFVAGSAESEKPIFFNQMEFINPNPNDPYQVNEFINTYGKDENGKVAYPLWLYFDKDYRLILRFYGLMRPGNILKVLDKLEAVEMDNLNKLKNE